MKSTDFSFIIPTRHGTERLRRLLDSIKATTHNLDALEVILVVDSDDEQSIQFQYDGVRLKRVEVAPGLNMGALHRSGYRVATGQYLMLLNDDVVLHTPGWDEQVLAAFRSYTDGIAMVHVNDLFFRETLCIFPFVTRELCRLMNGICPAGYVRYAIDNHIQNIFELLADLGHSRKIYLPGVVFEHTNVTLTATGSGYVLDPVMHQVDLRTFDSLREDRQRIAAAAKRHIEDYRAGNSPRARNVSIAILSAGSNSARARKCLELVKTCTADYDLILIDTNNAPSFHRARTINRLLDSCNTNHLVLLDDDVFVTPGWLEGMLRALDPEVGVVTPLHKDSRGGLSYAGIVLQPDDNGGYSHILDKPEATRRIQTLSSSVMLIDMSKCGHLRLDEDHTPPLLGIDYGLRVWEAGFQVVCSPHAVVTHRTELTAPTERELSHYIQSWVTSGRLHALRQGVWKTMPEISWIGEKTEEIHRLFEERDRDRFMRGAASLVRSLAAYPALKDYIAGRAFTAIGENRIRVDDPNTGHLAFLLGLTGRPVLFEADFQGSNIVLENFTYYAVPHGEQFRHDQRLEAQSPEELKQLIRQRRHAPAPKASPPEPQPAQPESSIALPIEIQARNANGAGELAEILQALSSREQTIAELSAIIHGRSRSPDAARINPLVHFMETGAYQGHAPNPLFDPVFYLAQNPDVAAAGLNPLAHFMECGATQGRKPNPLFDTAYYLRQNPDVARAGINPLEHFLEAGAKEGRKPNPLFDTAYYLQHNEHLIYSRVNPLAHFLESGAREGCKPNPLFDTTYYLAQHPDLVAAGVNPLAHFLESGAKRGSKPNPLFDTAYYLERNPEVAEAGANPLVHFLETGAMHGRKPNPLFDTAYYLEQNPSLVEAGINPLAHFLETGWKEGYRPNPLFDTTYYVLQNPDVAEAGINPLAHFLEHAGTHTRSRPHGNRCATSTSVPPLSVVIPTCNHGSWLSETLEACLRQAGGVELEFIVIDDGSTDDTQQRLSELSASFPSLTWHSIRKVGSARARNLGADAARHDLILFLSDDSRPMNDDFFRIHASAHCCYTDSNLAALGRVTAHRWKQDPIACSMARILGRGGAQFGDYHLTPYAFLSWPYFDAANVSVKKTLVRDWILDGFSSDFDACEDLELACRLAKSSSGLRIYYDPAATSGHHDYTLCEVMDRQTSLGAALAHLIAVHPELTMDCNPQDFLGTLRAGTNASQDRSPGDHRLLLEGLKAWARIIAADSKTGPQPWHDDLFSEVLELCLLDGFASAWAAQNASSGCVAAVLARRLCERMGQSLHPELAAINLSELASKQLA